MSMALSKLIAQAKNKIVPKYTHRLKVWSIGSSTPEELLVDTVFEGKKPGFYGDYVQPLLGTIRDLGTTKSRVLNFDVENQEVWRKFNSLAEYVKTVKKDVKDF